MKPRILVGITGATGTVYAIRLLHRLKAAGRETHLVASPAGVLNAHHELGLDRNALEALADVAYNPGDVGAAIASGSFATDAMVIVPCSMRSLAAVAHGLSDNLLTRAADVTLKERRRLVLMVRETPFNLAHLRNMTAVTEMGGIIYPPVPALYQSKTSLEDLVNHTTGRVLDLFGIETTGLVERWKGLGDGLGNGLGSGPRSGQKSAPD